MRPGRWTGDRSAHRPRHWSGRQLLRWTEWSARDTHVAVWLLLVFLRLTTAAAGSCSTAATGLLLVLGHPVVIASGAARPHAEGNEHPDEDDHRDESEDNDQTPHSTTQRHGLAVDAEAETVSRFSSASGPPGT
jgi:hypothetical protein